MKSKIFSLFFKSYIPKSEFIYIKNFKIFLRKFYAKIEDFIGNKQRNFSEKFTKKMKKDDINRFIFGYNISFTKFVSIYVAFTLVLYNFIFWNKIISAIKFSGIADFFLLIKFFIALFALFFTVCSIIFVKFTTKFLAILLLIINSVCAYFMQAYGVPIESGMLANAMSTDIKETMDLINIKLILYIVLLGILPSIVIFRTKIIYKSFFRKILRRILYCVIILSLAFATIAINYRQTATFVRENKSSFNYLIPRNYINAVIDLIEDRFQSDDSTVLPILEDAKIKSKSNKLVIVVVGETARRQNFSLYGYGRQTNPLLKNDGVTILNNVSSCGTATKISVPCIFSHLQRSDFVDLKNKYEFLPSALAKNGISVLYKDNNFGGCYGTCDNVEKYSTVNEKSEKFCKNGECVDGILLEKLPEYIKKNENKNTLIVLHQNGSHGPRYNKRYPKEFEIFKNVCNNNDVSKCSKEELINAYDNTILYTDFIIHNVIEIAKKSKNPSVVIYVSDHGESLGENGIYLHGFPYMLAPDIQKSVPLIIWMSDSFKQSHQIDTKKEKYSHDNIFHSILGAFEIETKAYNKELDIFKK